MHIRPLQCMSYTLDWLLRKMHIMPQHNVGSLSRGYSYANREGLFCSWGAPAMCLTALIVIITFVRRRYTWQFGVSDSILGVYGKYAVAADNALCSQVGGNMFKQDGSVVDAAIATLICCGVMNSFSMGIGGGFHMVLYTRATKEVVTIDARDRAPLEATKEFYNKLTDEQVAQGGYAVGTPGEIAGMWSVHELYGRLPWRQLFQPTINFCTNGFPVSAVLSAAMHEHYEGIRTTCNRTASWMLNADGAIYQEGEIMKCLPEFTRTLRRIADSESAANEFYNGTLGEDWLADLREYSTLMTKADLQSYAPRYRIPLEYTMNTGDVLHVMRPPSSGAILAYIINILEGYHMTADNVKDFHFSVLTFHQMVEAFKFAFAKRSYLGDEDYVAGLEPFVAELLNSDFGENTRRNISDDKTYDTSYYRPQFGDAHSKTGTTHISLLAANGDAVAVTSTINTHFGSLITGRRTGILFNNGLDDFSIREINYFGLPPSPHNWIEGGKRSFSSMSPAIITNTKGDVTMVIGASGGTRITTATAYTMARLLWFNESPKVAVDAGRLHHQLVPTQLQHEEGFPTDLLSELQSSKGHDVLVRNMSPTSVQAIAIQNGKIYANCDFRKGGAPAGL